MGRRLWIPNNEFHLGVPVLYMVYCPLARDVLQLQSIQPTRKDVVIVFSSNPVLRQIMPSVSKPTCTHVIIISLWLICHIQCGFSISYLSIPEIAVCDRCNISHVFLFFFSALMWCWVCYHYSDLFCLQSFM